MQLSPHQFSAVISSKGQLVIPKALREEMGYATGMKVIVEAEENGSLHIHPQTDPVDVLFSMVKPGEMGFIDDDQVLMDNIVEHDKATR